MDELGTVLTRWLVSVADGTGPTAELHLRVRELLVRVTGPSAASLDPAELDDVVDEALARSVQAVAEGVLDLTRADAPGYVVVTARHVAVDRMRRRRDVVVDPGDLAVRSVEAAEGPEAILIAMITAEDSVDRVARAIRALDGRGRSQTIKVVATWLDQAQILGKAPSSRVVGARCGVSHTAVRQHLERFRDTLLEVDLGGIDVDSGDS